MESQTKLYSREVLRIFDAYVEAALWSTCDDNDEPLDTNYGMDDIDPATLEQMREDCAALYEAHRKEIETWGGDGGTSPESQAGHDFWFSRNGHGVGFWEDEWSDAGEILHAYAEKAGQVDLYVGDDGKIYA